jgi:hypothetical protein
MGTKIKATMSMIFNVSGLDDELKAVRLNLGFMLDGNILGKRPIIPKKVVPRIVSAEANHALK